MYSDRLCKFARPTLALARFFGVTCLEFDPNQQAFFIIPVAIPKLKLNFRLLLLWMAACYAILFQHYQTKRYNKFYLTLSWLIGYSLLTLTFSHNRYFYREMVATGHGLAMFLQKIQSKILKSLNYSINPL